MRFLALLVIVTISSTSLSQICRDKSRNCHQIYCRFFPSLRSTTCRRTCGMCKTDVSTTLRTTMTTTTTTRRTTTTQTTTRGPTFNTWSACSRSCDTGTRFRVRRCSLNDFQRCPREFQDCNTRPCPQRTCRRNQVHRYNINSACCDTVPSNRGQCGVYVDPDARIIGGAPAMQGQWPWMVRLEIRRAQTSICGGALLNSEWVLTAAHCVDNTNLNQVFALVGYGTPNQVEINVDSYIIHPGYNLPLNDIALVKLARPAVFGRYVQKICLPNGERTEDDKKCFIAGWGVTNNNNPVPSPVLQEARLRILPYRVCSQAYQNRPFANQLRENLQICAGSLTGAVDSCFGDSGGPIMCQRCSSCAWYMSGIVSIGPLACGTPNEPGIYTRVVSYESWIRQHVSGLQTGSFSCL